MQHGIYLNIYLHFAFHPSSYVFTGYLISFWKVFKNNGLQEV